MNRQDDNALRIRFSGGRFNAGIVPTNVLGSLDHYARLIADTTWQEYSEETGQTKRGTAFNEAVALGLAAVESGSTVATFSPAFPSSTLPGLGRFEHCRERAIKRVHTVVVAAARNEDLAMVIAPQLLTHFEMFVPDLREDERIGIPDSVGAEPRYAYLNCETRGAIIAASKAKPMVGPGVVYAYVPKINKRTRRFEMATVDGLIHKDAEYAEADFETLHHAWESYRSELGAGNPIRIIGEMESTQHHNIQAVKSVSAIEKIDPLDVRARLHHLAGLKDGWYDGKGSSYSRGFLDSLADRFDRWYPSDLPNPAIFPHADGTIGCEWSLTNGECNLVVNPRSDIGEWIDFDLNDDDDMVERDLNLKIKTDWDWFVQRVVERAGKDQP